MAYHDWPRFTLAEQQAKGLGGILRDSVFPSPWWLRAYYGEGPLRGGYWRAWFAHQRWIAAQIAGLRC